MIPPEEDATIGGTIGRIQAAVIDSKDTLCLVILYIVSVMF